MNKNKYKTDDKDQKYSGSYTQKILCNVTNCAHNCLDDCSCRLDKIQVAPCGPKGDTSAKDETLCSSYLYSGNLNSEEKYGL